MLSLTFAGRLILMANCNGLAMAINMPASFLLLVGCSRLECSCGGGGGVPLDDAAI
jgi:hypothetical protein